MRFVADILLPSVFAAMLLGLPGCGTESQAALYYDHDMLERDGVVTVWNGGGCDVSGVHAVFELKPGCGPVPSEDVCGFVAGQGQAAVHVGDIPAGESVELDVSGMLHMYADLEAGYYITDGNGTQAQPAEKPAG